MGGVARGHTKSLSTSSISSVGSNFSTREDLRRRPPPLVMADPRFPYQSEVYPHRPPSPSDFSTPTSSTFSTGQNSPGWGTVMVSPTSPHTRSHSLYVGSQIPTRRLSVPSGGIPFQSQHALNPLGRPIFGPGSPGAIGGVHPTPYSPTSSVLASPTTSSYPRRESGSVTEDFRRRTWHSPSTHSNSPSSSRLSHVYTPDQHPTSPQGPSPLSSQQQHEQSNTSLRLPGIDSFGPLPHRPVSALRNNAPPMMMKPDVIHSSALLPTANAAEPEEKRGITEWDMSLHRGLTRLDITPNSTPSDSASNWAREANHAMNMQADRVRLNPQTVRFHDTVMAENTSKPTMFHQHTMSAPSISSYRQPKRRGLYQGSRSPHAEAPPEKMARVDRMVHPNIREFSGFPAREAPSLRLDPREENPRERDMVRLEALVAVATGEGNATKAY